MAVLAWGITLITFTLLNVVPADPAAANLGSVAFAHPSIVKAFREHYGLDRPLPVQYGLFLLHLARGDLGESEQSRRPVTTDLAEYIPATAEMAVAATALTVLMGIGLGTLGAVRHNGRMDQVLRIFSLSSMAIPSFWLALLAAYLFFFKLGWLPSGGRLDAAVDVPPHVTGLFTLDSLIAGNFATFVNALQHLILPSSVLATYNIGMLTRFTRASVLDVIGEDYIQVARAKGLSALSVLRHILRSALPPITTVTGFMFADLLTGTVLIETIFNWPGIGRYAFRAATSLDLPAMMGVTLFVSLVFVSINLIVDIAYGVIDPRLRIG